MAEIGSLLRETRMRERIDITTVESATKIRAKYLRALENEEWDQLPGPTFVRTFLRTYAEYLGLDPKMLVEDYRQRYERPGPQDVMPFASRQGRRSPRPSRGIPPWALVVLVFVVLIAVLFVLGSLGGDNTDDSPPTPTPTPSKTTVAKPRHHHKKQHAAPAAPKVVALKIVPQAPVNVCLENAAGSPLIRSQTLTGPTSTYRSKRLRVTFGNGQVTMRIAGKTYPVPDTDHAVGFELRPGKPPKALPQGSLPTCA
jgi:cytoskeleton protein RodZ